MAWLKHILKHTLEEEDNRLLLISSPLVFMHLACIGIFFTGFSWVAVVALLITYFVRVFALTAGFHRYFSHRSFKTSRFFQFIMAWVGTSAAQMGPMWWAAHHRHHHQHSDTEEDVHSPVAKDLFWAHVGWVLCRTYGGTKTERVQDLYKFPELRFIDRLHALPAISLGLILYYIGQKLNFYYPELGTSGWQLVMWGFFLSTALVYHVTFCVNSVTHIIGNKRFKNSDESRNNFWIALLTFGEGWHNNHHRYPLSARQGMYWWEFDLSYLLLRGLEKLGLVWDLKTYPKVIYKEASLMELEQD
tara:strand:- start:1320 stop:2228 length:909 start_codon:yes stop_codon:yes gene_type:complete